MCVYSVNHHHSQRKAHIDMDFIEYKNNQIETEIQLRKHISAYPKILDKRIQTELDHYCLEFISLSTLVISAFGHSTMPMMPLSKSDVEVIDKHTIVLAIDNLVTASSFASLYYLVPGVGHGLRVNGRLQRQGDTVVFEVKSAFFHCARAAARAAFWNNAQSSTLSENIQYKSLNNFITASPYLFIKTMNEMGETELSPRGDHAGFVQLIDTKSLFIPERPGNKVAVSLRNIIKNKKVELLFFIPGTDYVMRVDGQGILTKDDQLLDLSVVNNKRPKLGVLLVECRFSIEQNSAIQHAELWLDEKQVSPDRLTRFSKALSAHMNGEGIIGKATTPFIDAVVKKDMRNLY